MTMPVVCIIGRPNVGKSTFFNRCSGSRLAIVDDTPGVTRDRIYNKIEWSGCEFLLIDTGGMVPRAKDGIIAQVEQQAQQAIDESDVVIFMVDGKTGLSGADEEVAKLLHKAQKPVILAVNKIDRPLDDNNRLEFFKLGLGEPYGLSALRGTGGTGDLLDAVVRALAVKSLPSGDNAPESSSFSLAIVGRPNVGKSSIINAICGFSRAIVHDLPGTTRDALDTVINWNGKKITIIDTAGIRRRSKVEYGLEAFSVVRSINAISRADVAALILDINEGITDQDQKIATKISESGKAALIVLNKWDLVEDRSSHSMNNYLKKIKDEIRQLAHAEVLFVSALNKQRLNKILEIAERAYQESTKRVTTSLLNQVINDAVALVPPPSGKRGKRLRIYYSTQVSTAPPTMVLFVNDPMLLAESYSVFLERKIREAFGFTGANLRLVVRKRERETRV